MGFRIFRKTIGVFHLSDHDDDQNPADEPDFEAMVEALLKVDPEGITGQTAGRDKKKADDPEG